VNSATSFLAHAQAVPALAVLKFSGNDAESFLQAQLSADLRRLGPDNWLQACYCNPKGRVLAVMTLWREKSAILTALPHEILDAVRNRLLMYRLRSNVEIEFCATTQLSAVLGQGKIEQLPEAPDVGHAQHFEGGSWLRLSQQRLLLVEHNHPRPTQDGDNALWWQACIDDQQAEILTSTQELFVPQMLNLDKTAVSFKKGCYPGQEVVARLHYLGKAKQRMVLASLSDQAKAEPGDVIVDDKDAKVGHVVVSCAGHPRALLSLRLDRCQPPLRLEGSGDGLTLDLETAKRHWLSVEQ
jgi:hypothetical protein